VSERAEPPLLEADARSAPFFAAAARGRLLLQRCTACAAWHFPVRRRCPACGREALEFAEASGRGVVHSHARAHRAAHPALQALLPLALVAVDLAEGVRVTARLATGSPPVKAGDAVEVAFEPAGEVAIPVFRPVTR
jgi:uncharacterized OB-fold protein